MSQLYNVTVPPGVVAGMQFQAQVGSQVVLVTCPNGAGPGSVVQVAGPPAAPPPVAVAYAQPAYSQPYQAQPAYGQPPQAYAQAQPAYAQPQPAYGAPQPAYGAPQPMPAGYASAPPPAYPVAPQAKQMYAAPAYKGKVPPPVHMQPTHAMQLPAKLERLYLGLGWRSNRHGLDLDASVVCFSKGKQVDLINFQKLRNVAQGEASVVHTGDVLTGQADKGKLADLERIYLLVPKLGAIDTLFLVVNVYTEGCTFADVTSAYCRLVNADSEQELGRFELTNLQGNALIFARVERHAHGHWLWVALGTGATGRTAHEVAHYINNNPNMNAKPTAYESVTGAHAGSGAKPTPQKPSRSWVAPALIGATAAGVAAAALIYTQPQLTQSMMGGVGNANPAQYMDFSNISMPELPIDIDLTPPGEIGAAFGEFAGSAAEAGGAFVQGAGAAGGAIVDSATAMASGIDLSPVGDAFGQAGSAIGQAGSAVGQGAQGAFNAAGGTEAIGNVGNGIGDAAEGGGECCGDCLSGIGDCLGSLGGFGE